jgi:uncharacterized protein YndB with AHSA1/START domain
MTQRQVTGTRIIPAAPDDIFALLADPAMHPRIDGSGSVLTALSRGPRDLVLGSRFAMSMKLGARYTITNTVVEYEAGRLISWRHFFGHRWRWQLAPEPGGATRVTETFDWTTARIPLLISVSGFPRRNKQAIDATLDRLAAMFIGLCVFGGCETGVQIPLTVAVRGTRLSLRSSSPILRSRWWLRLSSW